MFGPRHELFQAILRLWTDISAEEKAKIQLAFSRDKLLKERSHCAPGDRKEFDRRADAVLIAEMCERLHLLCRPDKPLPLYKVLIEEFAQTTDDLNQATCLVRRVADYMESLEAAVDDQEPRHTAVPDLFEHELTEIRRALLDSFYGWFLKKGDREALQQVYAEIQVLAAKQEQLAHGREPADLDEHRRQITEARVQNRWMGPEKKWLHFVLIETAKEVLKNVNFNAEVDDKRQSLLESVLLAEVYRFLHDECDGRAALCLSGGGIRSATFNLGVVQSLAHDGLLKEIHYLSTVSGGGYLGGWLSAWIQREGRDKVMSDLSRVQVWPHAETSTASPVSPLSPEPEPVQHLRAFSRYLAPRLSRLSADSLTLFGIYLRNLLLNWLVLVPLGAAFLLLPRLLSTLFAQVDGGEKWQWVPLGTILFGGISIGYLLASRPSLAGSNFRGRTSGQKTFFLICLLPLIVSAFVATWWWARFGNHNKGELIGIDSYQFLWLLPHPYDLMALALASALVGIAFSCIKRGWKAVFQRYFLLEALMLGLASILAGWLLSQAAVHRSPRELDDLFLHWGWGPGIGVGVYTVFAVPTFLGAFLLCAIAWLGLASYFTNDADREWYARSGALTLAAMLVWSGLCALVIFGPMALTADVARWILTPLGGLSGLVSVLLGKNAKSAALPRSDEGSSRKTEALLTIAAPIFLAFLIALVSLGTEKVLTSFVHSSPGSANYLEEVLRKQSILFAVLLGFGWAASLGMDINVFSLHASYRDRLIRAYLGASRRRTERYPNPFSGFDERDNLEMKALRGCRPFHVVNIALNLVAGKELAWQDRKAETFTISPLHAGSLRLGFRDTAKYGAHAGFLRRTLPWTKKSPPDRALSLGTAIAISGAAASPNMGYHSSPLVTFLMTLFNVRLGWWLGNPGKAGKNTYDLAGPRLGPRPIIAEALGLTTDEHPYVYLSDGGHFENLGLYEMIVRRCRYILVSDASEDRTFSFDDLGNALAKVRIDLGVPIDLGRVLMRRRAPDSPFYELATEIEGKELVPYLVTGRIRYSCVDRMDASGAKDRDGYLIYIKSSLNGSEPVDVLSYARGSAPFPHDSTADVMFSESQFESYRALGSHAAKTLKGTKAREESRGQEKKRSKGENKDSSDLKNLFEEIWAKYGDEPVGKEEEPVSGRQRYFFLGWGCKNKA